MALWGVTGSDVKNCGWNTAVGLGVAVGCAGVAYLVKKVAEAAYARYNPKPLKTEVDTFAARSSIGALVVGLGTAVVANMYIPGSRFALVTDLSYGKMFKLGTVQEVVGLMVDAVAKHESSTFAIVGAGGALATRFSSYALIGFGAFGAAMGAGYIAR